MKEITQIRHLSLWIFFLPLIAINLCLFISVNYNLFENTVFQVDQIGRSGLFSDKITPANSVLNAKYGKTKNKNKLSSLILKTSSIVLIVLFCIALIYFLT